MKYDVDYFIKKFEAIPEEHWISGGLFEHPHLPQTCALGHCGLRKLGYYPKRVDEVPEEVKALIQICGGSLDMTCNNISMGPDYAVVYEINDWGGPSPKQNMLNYLRNLVP